jgi:hypothetical protein
MATMDSQEFAPFLSLSCPPSRCAAISSPAAAMSLSAAAPVASLDAVVAAASDAAAPAAAATNTVTGADGPVKKARLPCSRVAATCLTCGVVGHRTDLCIAHLHPHVILHVTSAKKHRFATHLQALAAEAERAKQQAELSGEAVEWMPGDRLIVVDSAKGHTTGWRKGAERSAAAQGYD